MQLIHNPGLDHLCATHFLTLFWVSTHTLGITGLDKLSNRCVKPRRQVFLNFSAEQARNQGGEEISPQFRK